MSLSQPKLTLIGGPTLVMEWLGIRFLTDPTFDPAGGSYSLGPVTLTKSTGPALPKDTLDPIDVILLSHDQHSDNLDEQGKTLLPRAKRVLTTRSGAQRLGGNAIGLDPWGTLSFLTPGGARIVVTATPARHGPPGCEPICGDVIGFVLEREGKPDEGAIYLSGDTVWYEGVEEVARRFDVKLAILFAGAARLKEVGPAALTMTAQDAIKTARAMPAARIVPIHYEGWTHWSEGKAELQKEFDEVGLGNRLGWLEPGVPTSV